MGPTAIVPFSNYWTVDHDERHENHCIESACCQMALIGASAGVLTLRLRLTCCAQCSIQSGCRPTPIPPAATAVRQAFPSFAVHFD
jgi:hypothetical protein